MSNEKSLLDLVREIEASQGNTTSNKADNNKTPQIGLVGVNEHVEHAEVGLRTQLNESDKEK